MNSLKDLAKMLDAFGLPWANGGFRDGGFPAPPYIDIEAGYGESMCADNAAWCRWMPYDVRFTCESAITSLRSDSKRRSMPQSSITAKR